MSGGMLGVCSSLHMRESTGEMLHVACLMLYVLVPCQAIGHRKRWRGWHHEQIQ